MRKKTTAINELREEYGRRQAAIADMLGDIEVIEADIEADTEEAEKIAAAGFINEYVALQARIREAHERIDAKRIRIKAMQEPLPEKDLEAAWSDFRGSIDAELKKAMSDLRTRRKELADAFKKVMTLQKTAYATQELLTLFAGRDSQSFDGYALTHFPFDMLTMADLAPELNMLKSTGELQPSESGDYGKMLLMHKL